MGREAIAIPIEHDVLDSVSALLDLPRGPSREHAILLAHGAGAPMQSAFLESVSAGLVNTGFPVLRFQYAYAERMLREERRRPPDRAPRLEQVHRRALKCLQERCPGPAPILAGKSMGGRISSHLAAQGFDCSGLVFYGYPLHPARKPEKLRDEHFPALVQPALFLVGTRDALSDLELLHKSLTKYGGNASLSVIDGGDHDFQVPKRNGRTRDEVLAELVQRTVHWYETQLVRP